MQVRRRGVGRRHVRVGRVGRAAAIAAAEPLESRLLLASWGQAQKDIWNTGRADYAVPEDRLDASFFDHFLWQTRSPGSPADGSLGATSMSFFDGVGPNGKDLVVGTYHWPKGIMGLDRHTGRTFWFGNPPGGEFIGEMTPAFSNDGGTIYVVSDHNFSAAWPDGHPLMAFASASGPGTYWHNGAMAQPHNFGVVSPKVAPDGRVFLHAWNDRPYGATDTGSALTQTWAADSALANCYSDVAFWQAGDGQLRVIATGRAGLVKAFDATTGAEIWSRATGQFTDASPTVDPVTGNIYLPMGAGDVHVLGLGPDGTPLWGASPTKLVFDHQPGVNDQQRAQATGALSHDGSTYYFQTNSPNGQGRLYAIDTATGDLRWSFETGSKGWEIHSSRPIVTGNGVVIVGNNEGDAYYAIEDLGTSGRLVDRLEIDPAGVATASATLAPDGTLYLPLRIVETVGSESNPSPSFAVQNLFTAIDLTADPAVIVPLVDPRGLAAAPDGSVAVAESMAGRVGIFDAAGQRIRTLGQPGAADGQLFAPSDVALDAAGNLFVLDAGNGRVQVFDADGQFVRTFGAPGTSAGQLSRNASTGDGAGGLFVDALGRTYVADTLAHRVLRFTADGVPDLSWGGDGIVGSTGLVGRDHAGFDRPSDVAVNPATGEVYVADFGNHRVEVYDANGQYLRTYLAIYRPRQIAFNAAGDLFVAGEDPNEGYPPYDGRLRVLRRGDALLSAHYTGGLDDLGRNLTGVAVRPDGSAVVADASNGRLAVADPLLRPVASDVRVESLGTAVRVSWVTRSPSPSVVRYGYDGVAAIEAGDGQLRTSHSVLIEGLEPERLLTYAIGLADSFDGHLRFAPEDVVNTGVTDGHQFLRLKVAVGLYTDGNANAPGYARWPGVERHYQILDQVADYYWRNSGLRLWLDFNVIEIDRDLTGPIDAWGSLEADLAALGYSADDDFDLGMTVAASLTGFFGGGGGLFGRFVGMCQWVDWPFVAIHEANHAVDSIFHSLGLPKYQFNHGIWAVPGGLGHDFSINGQILRNMQPGNFTAARAPFTKVMVAPDADRDGVPDASPPGLTRPLSLTEATFNSLPDDPDSDDDGLSDLAEAIALATASTDPRNADTDGDGTPDAEDPNPLYRMNDRVASGTPTIDGAIDPDEAWTPITRNWGFANTDLVDDTDARQALVTTYAAWDDDFLYLAYEGPGASTNVRIDGGADNWFFGPSNYDLTLHSSFASASVQVNVGVPDIFRQIDNDGQWSELFDTNPMFTRPYQGRTTFDNPTDGLGFPGRLVTEAMLTYRRGASPTGTTTVWEVAIPWSDVTQLRGGPGRKIAIQLIVDGDRLFETDHFATLTLVMAGDANEDGRVDASDYHLVDRGLALGLTGWGNGDLDQSGGPPGIDDYLVLDAAFMRQLAAAAPAAAPAAGAATPFSPGALPASDDDTEGDDERLGLFDEPHELYA